MPDAIDRQLAHKEKKRDSIQAAYHRSKYMPKRIKICSGGQITYKAQNTGLIVPTAC